MTKLPSIFSKNDSSEQPKCQKSSDEIFKMVDFDNRIVTQTIRNRPSSAETNSITINKLDLDEKPIVKLVSPPPPTPPASATPSKSIVETPVEQLEKIVESMPIVNEKKELNDYHWMVYKHQETPAYIIEAKKRLGQIRQPNIVPNQVKEKPPKAPEKVRIKEEAIVIGETEKPSVNKHWMQWDNPATPDNISNIRRRLGDDRYKKSYSFNYGRLTTLPGNNSSQKDEKSTKNKPERFTLLQQEPKLRDEEAPTADTELENNGTNYLLSFEPKTEYVHTSFKSNLPYYHQVADAFNYFDMYQDDEAELKNLDLEIGNETNKLILPADENQKILNDRKEKSKSVPFQTWLKTAGDQDREAVMKILNDIEKEKANKVQYESRISSRLTSTRPASNYIKTRSKNNSNDQFNQSQALLKKRPTTSSSIRKLGVTRNKYQAPVDENLEKILIKHTLWSNEINGPATVHFGYNV